MTAVGASGRWAKACGMTVGCASRATKVTVWRCQARISRARAVKLAHLDLNKDKENQNLLCYRYTMGQTGCESQTFANMVAVELLNGLVAVDDRDVGCRAVILSRRRWGSWAAGTQGWSAPPCVHGRRRAGSTGDGHTRRGVGCPSMGPCPRLPQGWSVPWPRQDTPCGAAVAGVGSHIIRHRRPIKEGRKVYRVTPTTQATFNWFERRFSRCNGSTAAMNA